MKSVCRAALVAMAALSLGACHEETPPPGSGEISVQIGGTIKLDWTAANPPVAVPTKVANGTFAFAATTATSPAGTWRAFDRAGTDGVFDVVVTAPDGTSRIASERQTHQASAALAAGPNGRVWLAFEEGLEAWGRGANLRRARKVVLGEVLPSGAFVEVPGPNWKVVDNEAPELAVDGAGRPWLFVRTKKTWLPVGKKGADGTAANRRVAWSIQASVLDAAGWSPPVTLPSSAGPEDGALELEAQATGILARYFTDGRLARIAKPALSGAWDKALPGEPAWFETQLTMEASPPPPATPGAPANLAKPGARPNARSEALATLPTGMRLLWGDLHRHTDASRCKMDEDGDLEDAYRYALGTAKLDFLAITDHFQHMTPAVFERELATANAFDALDDFVAFPGYERALPKGHWTMIAREGADAAKLEASVFGLYRPRFLWDDFDPALWMAIPHQIADRAAPLTWDATGTDLDPVIELYQSRRGSYESRKGWLRDLGGDPEAPWAVDYLSDGRTFGVTASSDHATTDGAFTAVLIPEGVEPSREAIFAALRARRCYAATAPIGLDFTLLAESKEPGASTGPKATMGGEMLAADLTELAALAIAVDVRRLEAGSIRSIEVVHGHSNGQRGDEEVIATIAGELANHGLLTLRIGRAKNTRRVIVRGKGEVTFDDPKALGLENDDLLARLDGLPILTAALDLRDVDGFTAEVAFDEADSVIIEVTNGNKTSQKELFLADLKQQPSEVFWSLGARTSVRLDPLAHGASSTESWSRLPKLAAGDWLYVRVVTESGDAAWSSPIFIR